MRETWKIIDGSLHVRDAILPEKILKMHPGRHRTSKIQGAKRVERMFKKDDRPYEKNEDMIAINYFEIHNHRFRSTNRSIIMYFDWKIRFLS